MHIVDQQHVHLYENSFEHPTDEQDYPLYFGPYTYWTHFEGPDFESPDHRHVAFTAQGSVQLQSSTPDIQINSDVPYRFSGHNNDWFHSYLHLHLSLPYTPGLYEPKFSEEPGPWQHKSASCLVTLNGFDKGGDNHNGGWTIFNFGWAKDNKRFRPVRLPAGQADAWLDRYDVWAHIGIRGNEFRIDRVGFTFTAIGSVLAL